MATLGWTVLPSPASAAPTPVLQAPALQSAVGLSQGARGDGVKALQQALMRAGVTVRGGADGVFGPATRAAVQAFQSAQGLPSTGTVDQATADRLAAATGGDTAPTTSSGDLARGAKGPAVKEVQERLMALGVFVAGGADGVFGPATESAVKNFQRWNGLQVTGTVNTATAKRLQVGASTPPPATNPPATNPPPAQPPAAEPPATSDNPYVGLSKGAKGAKVKELQQALMRTGLVVRGGADGVFGPATESSVKAFQRVNRLPETGVLSARGAELLRLGPSGPATPPPSTTPPPASSPYLGLRQGSRGDLVKHLQNKLIAAGVSVRGGADGVFGPATKSALTQYQQAVGIGAGGAVDQATIDKLKLGSTDGPVPFAGGGGAATPPPSSSSPYVGLQQGARGAAVKELQQALMRTGLVVRGGADGVFGPATAAAVRAFQSVNGIPQTGVITAQGARILGLGGSTPPTAGGGSAGSTAGYAVFGERGERVRQLQLALLRAGISVNGGADGIFGSATSGAVITFQRKQGLPATGKVDGTTASRLGLQAMDPPAPPSTGGITLQHFPIEGPCWFGDTWHAPRGGGRLHEGVDIIAAEGKKLYAVVDGTITKMYFDYPGALAGNGLRVALDNGTYFTYLHLSAFADGIEVGTKVKAGDVIGYNGNTGNSATAHLHFEVHPGGGAAINPYPIVKAIDAC